MPISILTGNEMIIINDLDVFLLFVIQRNRPSASVPSGHDSANIVKLQILSS